MKPRVLYISNEDRSLGGSSLSLRAMLEALKGEVEPVILFRQEGIACDYFKDLGYSCLVVPFNRGTFNHKGLGLILRFIPHTISNFFVQRRCVKSVLSKVQGLSLVHSNSGTVDIGFAIARKASIPHIWHIREYLDLGLHQKPFPGWKSWKKKLDQSDTVIAISPGLLAHLGIGPHGICLPDAVCSAGDAVLKEKKDPVVLFIAGTVSEVKRPDEAVRIFAGAGLQDFCLQIVGSSSSAMKEHLTAVARECGVESAVRFVPFVSDVKVLLQDASALLVCTEFEGMGRVAIEAMFCGCPVIARGSGGSADVLEGGALGNLYTDTEEASAILRKVCEAPSAAQLRSAQEAAVRKYSTENYGKEILKIYSQLL